MKKICSEDCGTLAYRDEHDSKKTSYGRSGGGLIMLRARHKTKLNNAFTYVIIHIKGTPIFGDLGFLLLSSSS